MIIKRGRDMVSIGVCCGLTGGVVWLCKLKRENIFILYSFAA